MSENKIKIYERALAREKAARHEAERILEEKSRELYFKTEEVKTANRKLEELVREKTSELKGVFENIVDAYVVMNLSGEVIKMNEAAEILLGYKLEDGVNLMKLVHKDEMEKTVSGFKELLKQGAITDFQIRIVISNGMTRLVHVNASMVYDSHNNPIAAQGIVRDITNEKAAEQRIIESENRLSALILHLDSGVLLEDEHRNIVITNNRFCDFFNIPISPDQLIGKSCIDAAEESKDLFENPDAFVERVTMLTQIKKQTLSDELTLKDGRILERDYIPIYEEGLYKGHLWAYRDVTLKRKFSESIEAERQKYSRIIANMNLGLIEVNTDDEILMVNQSLEEMSGYKEAELLGKKGSEMLLNENFRETLLKENQKRVNGESNSYEVKARTKNGDLRHWLISGAPNYNINGQVVGSIGVHLDITELKHLELQKENLLKKLEKSNDQLQEYAHVVSHDLKSPLRSINALVSWIKDDNDGTLSEETLGNLNLIDDTLEKMEQLISDVLEYSSVTSESKVKDQVDVNEVLADIVKLLHFPEHVRLEVVSNQPIIVANRIRIQQLFQNLISNAIRFCDKEEGIIKIDCKESKTDYTFSIQDNGIGIEKEYHDKIFQIFQSLNKSKESTGIGLSIVKKIVHLYGGEIWLDSEVGVGTTFYFSISKTE